MKKITWSKISKWIYGVAIVLVVIGVLSWSLTKEVSEITMIMNTAAAVIAIVNTLILMILEVRRQYKEKGLVVMGTLTAEIVFFSAVYYLLQLFGTGKKLNLLVALGWGVLVVAASKTIAYYKMNK